MNKQEYINFSIGDKVTLKQNCIISPVFNGEELFIYRTKLIANNEVFVSTKDKKLITTVPYNKLNIVKD